MSSEKEWESHLAKFFPHCPLCGSNRIEIDIAFGRRYDYTTCPDCKAKWEVDWKGEDFQIQYVKLVELDADKEGKTYLNEELSPGFWHEMALGKQKAEPRAEQATEKEIIPEKQVLTTKRLTLRDFEKEDWEAVHDYASDPQVVRYVNFGPNSEEESRTFVRKALDQQNEQPRKNFTLAIVIKASNALIGGCGIYVTNPDNREGYIGYVLNRNFWRQGYATETARALLEFGFNKLKLHRIFATCDAQNTASAHVLEKIGMRQEAHFRENEWTKEKWRDNLLYAILDHEWTKSKQQQV